MNRLLVFLGCLVVLVPVLGCQSDILLPEAWPLVGTYSGTYSYITDYSGPDQKSISAYVIFIFDETAYHMNLDTAFTDQECFCAVDGQWALTEGVRLQENNSGPEEGCGACNEEMNPEGVFVLQTIRRTSETTEHDSLILKREEEFTQGSITLYELRLRKVPD